MCSLDTQLHMLSDGRRRRLLITLAEANPQTIDHPRAENPESKQYRIEMQHIHLPKLADADLIDWDRKSGQITKGTGFEEIRPLVEYFQERESTRS